MPTAGAAPDPEAATRPHLPQGKNTRPNSASGSERQPCPQELSVHETGFTRCQKACSLRLAGARLASPRPCREEPAASASLAPTPAPAASDPGTGLRVTAPRPQPAAHPSSPPPHLTDATPSSMGSPSPASTPPSLGSLLLHLLLLYLVLLLLTESGSSQDQPWASRPLLSR